MFSRLEELAERIKYTITKTIYHKLMISELKDYELMLLSNGKLNWEVKIRAITGFMHEYAQELITQRKIADLIMII